MKGKTVKILIVVLFLLIVCLPMLFLPVFRVEKIMITGNKILSEEEIRQLLTDSEGKNILLFNTWGSADNIKKNKYVQSASVERAFPSTIIVRVKEYKVRAYVRYMGDYLYLNDDGRVIDVCPDMKWKLPVLTGLDFQNFKIGEKLKVENRVGFNTMVDLSMLFEKYSILSDIVEVDISDITDIHLYVGKIDVEFGSMDNANRKILTLIEVVKKLDTNVAGKLNLTGANASFEYIT
ncbi:MAG: FtsQ-type POTRA domain-containing protein [Firmicutes bacterium]|nr:FtsQ-type POTRA domain-containing protein [Bacillota bacterium]